MVIVVFGLPGSGKSYFARKLAELIGADYLNSYNIRKQAAKKRTFFKRKNTPVHQEMLAGAEAAVDRNKHVILDGTFHTDATRKAIMEGMAEKSNVSFIEVKAEEELIRERLKNPRTSSDSDFKIYEMIRDNYESFEKPHLTVQSTNGNIERMLQQASFYLKWQHDNAPSRASVLNSYRSWQ